VPNVQTLSFVAFEIVVAVVDSGRKYSRDPATDGVLQQPAGEDEGHNSADEEDEQEGAKSSGHGLANLQ